MAKQPNHRQSKQIRPFGRPSFLRRKFADDAVAGGHTVVADAVGDVASERRVVVAAAVDDGGGRDFGPVHFAPNQTPPWAGVDPYHLHSECSNIQWEHLDRAVQRDQSHHPS